MKSASVILETKVRPQGSARPWVARARFADRPEYVLDNRGRKPLQAHGPTAAASVDALAAVLPQGTEVLKRVKYDTNCQRWESV